MPKPMTPKGVEQTPRSFDELVTIASHFAEGLDSFLRLDSESQDLIRQLVEELRDPSLDDDERDSVYSTIAQSLFREAWDEESDLERPAPEDAIDARELDREEAGFADRLGSLLKEKG